MMETDDWTPPYELSAGGVTEEQRNALDAELDTSRVKTRQAGGGRSVSYLPAHEVKRTLNRIFGHAGWSYSLTRLELIGEEEVQRLSEEGVVEATGTRVAYRAVVRLTVSTATYEDVGFGEGTDYRSELMCHELAVKEAVSDALKRCAMNLGDPLGLALWDKESDANAEVLGRRRGPQQQRAPRKISRAQVTRLQALCGELGIDVEDRHAVTRVVTGVESLNDVTTDRYDELEQRLRGFAANPEASRKWLAEHGGAT